MATRKRRSPSSSSGGDEENILLSVQQYEEAKNVEKSTKTRIAQLRERIVAYVSSAGTPDDAGHVWLDLPESVGAKDRIKYERRVSQHLDEPAAIKFLKRKKLLEECQTTIVVLDESKILAQYHEGNITEEELDKLYTKGETWALKIL